MQNEKRNFNKYEFAGKAGDMVRRIGPWVVAVAIPKVIEEADKALKNMKKRA